MRDIQISDKVEEATLSQIISEESCPDAGRIEGAHYFRELAPDVVCNCTIWLIVHVRLPIVILVGPSNIKIVKDLSKE